MVLIERKNFVLFNDNNNAEVVVLKTVNHLGQKYESRRKHESPCCVNTDHTDSISLEFPDWRFNLRSSNTEPVVRLNVESRAATALMTQKTEEILSLLRQ
jgi:phosphomannomutase